jgi:archaeosine-15-forming tRNA-guanine transglycosylase
MLLSELSGAFLEEREFLVRVPRFKVEIRDDLKQFKPLYRHIEANFLRQKDESVRAGRDVIELLHEF